MDDRGYVIPVVGLRKAAEEERNKKIPLRATRPTPFLSSLDETLSGWGPNENVPARVVEPEVTPTVVEPDENPVTRAVRVVRSIPSRAVDTAADLARKLISSDEYQSTGDRLVQDNRVNFGDPNVAADFFRASDALKRMGYSEGGMPEGVPEWATPRTPEDASAAINRERERLAKEQELARMNTPEFQQQTADRMFQESFSPERLARMTPGYVEPTYRDAAINDALSYARQLERQQRRQDVAGALAQTWPAQMAKSAYEGAKLPGDVALGRTDPRSDEAIKRAIDLAGLTMSGTLASPPVSGAVMGAGPVRSAPTIQRELTPMGFYSHGAEAAMNLPQAKGTPEQIVASLRQAGVKPDELFATGIANEAATAELQQKIAAEFKPKIDAARAAMEGMEPGTKDFDKAERQFKNLQSTMRAQIDSALALTENWAGKPSVTREEVAQHFRERMPQIEETVLGGKPTLSDADFARDYDKLYEAYVSEKGGPPRHDGLLREWANETIAAEIVGRNVKYGDYVVPGGENYREVLLKMPHEEKRRVGVLSNGTIMTEEELANPVVRRTAEKIGLTMEDRMMPTMVPFKSQHWDEPNVLAHIRMSDRRGPNGEKVLHVEELQSDWGQKGKKEGFREQARAAFDAENAKYKELTDSATQKWKELEASGMSERDIGRNSELIALEREAGAQAIKVGNLNRTIREGLPSAPYVTSTQGWTDLALKRVLREAAENGYDKVVWTPGAEQAKRYDLAEHVKSLAYDPEEKTLSYVRQGSRGEGWIDHPGSVEPKDLAGIIGKEAADRLLAQKPNPLSGNHILEGENLSFGGEGMKGYYDKIVPTQLQKILKKIDPQAKVGMTDIMLPPSGARGSNNPPIEAPGITITPQMRENILRGLPHMAEGGAVPRRGFDEGGVPSFASPEEQNAQLNDAIAYARQIEKREAMNEAREALAQTWPARAVKDIYGAVTLPGDVALGRTDPRSDEVIKRALDLAFLPVGNAPAGAIGAGIRLRPTEGVKQVQRGTPEHAVANARPELSRLVSPFSDDPESVRRALEIAATYRVPQGTEFGTNSFFRNKPSMSVKDIQPDIGSLPGVTPVAPRPINWEQFGKEAKGGTMINVGGDRLNLGLLRDINNEGRLAWEVPLHAGPKYMLEPNPGLVWANAPTHTTSFNKIIAEAAKKGPVYGVYAPMGPTAVDSSVGMFNAVMSQIPTAKISRAAAKEFDDMVRSGIFTNKIKDRPSTAKTMGQIWPGISKIKDQETVLKLAGEMTGTQRGDLVKAMEATAWRNKNFPEIGVTRVAVTDPALLSTPTNTVGHRIVKFDTEGLVKPNRKFMHQTYPTETRGQYFADVPVVQTQYGMPIPMQQRLLMPDKSGNISHPYSLDTMGRSNARKLFTEQKQTQPIDDRMIESILLGLKRQKEYGFRRGGSIPNHAVAVAKLVHGDQWK